MVNFKKAKLTGRTIIAIIFVLSVTMFAFAQQDGQNPPPGGPPDMVGQHGPGPGGPGGGPHPGGGQQPPEMNMKLTDAQKEQLRAIHNRYNGLIEDVQFEVKRARFQLASELRKTNPDRTKIDATIDEITKLQNKKHKLVISEFFEIRKILTEEQSKFFVRRMIRKMMNEN